MEKVDFVFWGAGGTELSAVVWTPEQPRAVLQIAHGMTEHMGRYEALASEMAERGIAVAGFDLRGHGRNTGDQRVASCGEGGWAACIEDMRLFHTELRERFPGVRQFMMGFSLGSMKRCGSSGEYDSWYKNLPILLISGGEDPVGNGGKGVAAIRRRMQESGMNHVTMKLIPGARHDILHDSPTRTNMTQTALAQWLAEQMGSDCRGRQ